MAEVAEAEASSAFSHRNSRIPEDTVFYAIFSDFSLQPSETLTPDNSKQLYSSLQSLHLQILKTVSPYLKDYIWQHEPFNLSLSSNPKPNCSCSSQIPHLHGKTRYGDNLEDEWFVVFLLFEITRRIPSVSARVWDTDGEFLLIEAAFSIPRWINPENSSNRVFIRRGELYIVPKDRFASNPSLFGSLKFLVNVGEEARASDSVQLALKNRILGYPERARRNMHRVRVRVPVSVAQVLKHEPCLISLAVEGFYDRDIDSMKYASRMVKFLSGGTGEELVRVSVLMSRAMYAQLVQQTFQAPKCYPMPPRTDASVYMEAELGMKIACGFEMIYQQRCRERSEGKGSSWDAFRESLESSGYFEGLLPGSKDYRRLMENAHEYYRNSSVFTRTSEMMSAPERRIDEILALPHPADEFKGVDLPPSDDDAWLYDGEDELNSALLERQKEMELYELNRKEKLKSRGQKDSGQSSGTKLDDFDLGDIAKTMQAFVHNVSSYEGAEVPENRDSKAVDLDVDRFMRDMESVIGRAGCEGTASYADMEEGSSSDMDFGRKNIIQKKKTVVHSDKKKKRKKSGALEVEGKLIHLPRIGFEFELSGDESEDGSDLAEPSGDNEDRADTFMHSYSDALNDELKTTTLQKSFICSNEPSLKTTKSVLVSFARTVILLKLPSRTHLVPTSSTVLFRKHIQFIVPVHQILEIAYTRTRRSRRYAVISISGRICFAISTFSSIKLCTHESTKQGASDANDMDDEFTPVDVDVNLVKSLLDSFSSQQGLPGPASNLLGLMGLQLPQDASKDK
ncbi:hypothetical protein HHK36_030769 [Tetracentron sinense]|uniref:Uncharacterized protein n=1 Tax=Tetracentron sinense TaxID=13715 RepID=A0A835CYL1_TETSI|nr:hypothetical protein HHK36_030769 [Tetracentron sinense]